MDLEGNKALVLRFAEAVNVSDWDALDELFTQDFRRHCQATPDVEINSLEEFKEFQKRFVIGFPDQRITADLVIAEGDYVATYGAYKATNTGPMGGIPATGKAVDVKMLTIFRIEKGKIAELWVEWDNMAMLSQLGLMPPPAP